MKFYLRKFKNDFIPSNIDIKVTGNSFVLSWFKGVQVVNLESHTPEMTFPAEPTVSQTITPALILTERKTGVLLNNPHQVFACGASEESGKFIFTEVLKHTYVSKGSTGYFKNASNINPIMYIFVPFADSPMTDWVFVAITNTLTVDDVNITEEFDIDIDRSLAKTCKETLPGISISKTGNTVSAQLRNPDGNKALKANVDIYFETTAGYLTKARSKTNDLGIATTEVIGAIEGKVKAGFKNFSGKAEVNI